MKSVYSCADLLIFYHNKPASLGLTSNHQDESEIKPQRIWFNQNLNWIIDFLVIIETCTWYKVEEF